MTPTSAGPADPSAHHPVIAIRSAGLTDLPSIQRLAYQIWHAYYPALLSPAQIDLMLTQMYATEVLAGDLEQRSYAFDLVLLADEEVGYLSYRTQPNGRLLLAKCYLHPDLHGRGVGQRMLAWVDDVARCRGLPAIELMVNRRNHRALRAYRRHGYQIEAEVVTPLPGGFVMDDYRLVSTLGPSA